jgi:hypothetical protein
MPTFNGIEITNADGRKISGLSLTGRTEITISGFSIAFVTVRSMFISGMGNYPDPTGACIMGPNDTPYKVYAADYGHGSYSLFSDSSLTTELAAGWYWATDTTNIGGAFDGAGQSILVGTSGEVVTFQGCRR